MSAWWSSNGGQQFLGRGQGCATRAAPCRGARSGWPKLPWASSVLFGGGIGEWRWRLDRRPGAAAVASTSRGSAQGERCRGQPADSAMASSARLSVALGDAELHAREAAGRRLLRNSRQKASVSASPTSMPMTSRLPVVDAAGDHERLVADAAGLSRRAPTLASSQTGQPPSTGRSRKQPACTCSSRPEQRRLTASSSC